MFPTVCICIKEKLTSRVWPDCRSLQRQSVWHSLVSVPSADRSGCPELQQEPNSLRYSRSARYVQENEQTEQHKQSIIKANVIQHSTVEKQNRITYKLLWTVPQTHSVCVADLLDIPLLIPSERKKGNGSIWAATGQDQPKVIGTPAHRVHCSHTKVDLKKGQSWNKGPKFQPET